MEMELEMMSGSSSLMCARSVSELACVAEQELHLQKCVVFAGQSPTLTPLTRSVCCVASISLAKTKKMELLDSGLVNTHSRLQGRITWLNVVDISRH